MILGIVTVWDNWISSNYGSLFQCYALQQYLRQIGHSPFLICRGEWGDVCKPKRKKTPLSQKITHPITCFCSYLRYKKKKKYSERKIKQAKAFIDTHIRTSRIYLTNDELISAPPQADGYIVGSDQVWTEENKVAFLGFHSEKFRLAYAVSGKFCSISTHWKRSVYTYLSQFRGLSCREEELCNTCREIGFHAEHVLDPVFLLSMEHYSQLASTKLCPQEKYLLVYILNVSQQNHFNLHEITCFAKEKGLKVIIVTGQRTNVEVNMHKVVVPSPEEFLGLFQNATFIVTNSYHGMLFSIIFKRSFVVISQQGTYANENFRFLSILKLINQEHRLLNGLSSKIKNLYTPLQDSYSELNNMIDKSKFFLNKHLTHY